MHSSKLSLAVHIKCTRSWYYFTIFVKGDINEFICSQIKPIYEAPNNSIKICFLNARSLHKHIDDICHDLNYLSTDVNIFSETRFSQLDDDNLYHIKDYTLFRNDDTTRVSQNTRPF